MVERETAVADEAADPLADAFDALVVLHDDACSCEADPDCAWRILIDNLCGDVAAALDAERAKKERVRQGAYELAVENGRLQGLVLAERARAGRAEAAIARIKARVAEGGEKASRGAAQFPPSQYEAYFTGYSDALDVLAALETETPE